MDKKCGIEDLNVYASSIVIDADELMAKRKAQGIELPGLELNRKSVAPSFEDAITFAVNAAAPLLENNGKDAIDLLIVGTESGVDYGKPISSYIHKYLTLPQNCRNFEVKHACYGGTAALQMALSYVRSTGGKSRALVIMTDIARKLVGEPAEMLFGAGSVATIISSNPEILEIAPLSGFASREIFDVTRPTATAEYIDGELSLAGYLDLFEIAMQDFQKKSGLSQLKDCFKYMLYHTPLISLVKQAHELFLSTASEVSSKDVEESFKSMVTPSLGFFQNVGNIYGGNLYLALASLLSSATSIPEGTQIGMFSYGSGACAEFYSGKVGALAQSKVKARKIFDHLNSRLKVSIPEYENIILDQQIGLTQSSFKPDFFIVPGLIENQYIGKKKLVLDGVENFYRNYSWK